MNCRVSMLIINSALLLYSCQGSVGAGTLGGWKTLVFPVVESKLDSTIQVFFKDNPMYLVPENLKYEEDSWQNSGFGFLKSHVFYFKNSPEEMFYVTYVESGFGVKNPNWARIAIRSVYSEKGGWKKREEYSLAEQDRIQNRFYKEICFKLEKYAHVKSSDEK